MQQKQLVIKNMKNKFDKINYFSLLLRMSALTAAKRTELETKLAKKQALLLKYYTAIEDGLDSNIKRYKFDSGEGSQSAEYLDPEKLQKNIDLLESQINTLMRQLAGGNLRRFTLNRKPSGIYHG